MVTDVSVECIGEYMDGTKIYRKVYSDGYVDFDEFLHSDLIEIYEEDYEENISKEPLPTNCKNCGAILHSHECEYCGSEYY